MGEGPGVRARPEGAPFPNLSVFKFKKEIP
jgi:hypothetical protein